MYSNKNQRAYGGCLGTERRRRTWETAISLDKLLTSIISRGCPNGETPPIYRRVHTLLLGSNPLKLSARQSGGIETSQYSDEKKTK